MMDLKNELHWHRTKNAARRLLKNQMRAAVVKTWAAADAVALKELLTFEEGAVRDAQEAYREALSSWALVSAEDRKAFHELLQIALAEAADHAREHYADGGIPERIVVQALDVFMTAFDPEALCPPF